MAPDSTLTVDPAAYATASKKCNDLADAIGAAFNPLYQGLFDSTGMVGDYEQVKPWADAYDKHIGEFVTTTTTLVNAIQNIGDLLAFAGYNYAISEYLNTDKPTQPPPSKPTVTSPPYGAENPVITPGSVLGHRGDGIRITKIPGLLDHITVPVPNGDTGLLKNAADAWTKFIGIDAVKNAADTLKNISSTLTADLRAPDLDHFADHFTTLVNSAGDLHAAASAIAPIVAAHHDRLDALHTNVYSATNGLLVELGAIAATATVAVIATTIFTFGLGLAGGDEAEAGTATAAGAVAVAEVGTSITTEITTFVTAVLAGATAAFGGVTELGATALAAIAALGVLSVAGDSGPSSASDDINNSPAGPFAVGSQTSSVGKIAQHYGVKPAAVREAIHEIKAEAAWRGLGSNKNPDVVVDLDTGEVHVKLPDGSVSEDSIGNIEDSLEH